MSDLQLPQSKSNVSKSLQLPKNGDHERSGASMSSMESAAAEASANGKGQHPPKFRNRTKSITGETIFKEHPSHDIMLNIKLGVRHTIGHASAREQRELTLADFQLETKKDFPSQGSPSTPKHRSSDFKFKDYAPLAFRHIRTRFGIDTADYMVSIGGESALRELPTPGKSGALFYMTKDDRFLIKTISKQESKYFRDILAQYYNHVMMHRDTLLPRFFQLFRIKTSRGRFIRMVVMHNILPSHLFISERYDLKGSTHGRRTDTEHRGRSTVTLKDLDFMEMGKRLKLGPDKKKRLMRQLTIDCTFLQNNKLMDYSLLVGVKLLDEEVRKDRDVNEADFIRKRALTHAPREPPPMSELYEFDGALECRNEHDQPVLVYCGIIDILQEYDMRKQFEHLYKGAVHDKHTISAVAPDRYAQRFVEYLKHHVFQ